MKTSLDTKDFLRKTTVFFRDVVKHAAFLGVLVVLLTYILVVWQISKMATAGPSSAEVSTSTQISIPRIDQKAIKQIQSLEQSNTEVHSLFDQARNNPFQE